MLRISDTILVRDVVKDIVDKMNTDFDTDVTFYASTPIEVNNERVKDYSDDGVSLKYPFIALFEPIELDYEYDNSSPNYGDASLWMVFMTDANYCDWTTNEHYDNAIDMTNDILHNFLQTVEKRIDNTIGRPTGMQVIPHAKWGLVAKAFGYTSNLFADSLSGIELNNFNLPILKSNIC